MEADWEFEIAADAPVVDGAWTGFIDLRREPERVFQLPETAELPYLANVLVALNTSASPVRTAKCDLWEPEEFDRDELNATEDDARHAFACYVDLLSADEETWSTLEGAADWCRAVCMRLRSDAVPRCRADLVIRRAFLTPSRTGIGITAYVVGCGPTRSDAGKVLATALCAFAKAVGDIEVPALPRQSYNGDTRASSSTG